MLWSACQRQGMRPVTTTTRIEALQTPWSSGRVWARVWSGLLGWRLHHVETKSSMTWKGSSSRVQGLELGVSKLGRECGLCPDSFRWPWLMLREMVPASSFIPREVSLGMLSLLDMLWDEQLISLWAPGALQIAVSRFYVCRLIALPFL